MKKLECIVNGMMCANCKATVEHSLKKTKGVKEYSVNLATKKVIVSYDDKITNFDSIKNNIEKEGYEVFDNKEIEIYKNKVEEKKHKDKIILIITGVLATLEFIFSMGVMLRVLPDFYSINPILFMSLQLVDVIAVIILSFNIFKKGYFNLFRFHPSMESLVSLGCTASLGYSLYSYISYIITYNSVHLSNLYFESVVVILFLIQLGKYFETKSLAKANNSINELLKASPSTCKVLVNNEVITKEINEVIEGEIIFATVGDSIAFDGKVIEGNCSIDESMLTGESIPNDKVKDSLVFCGTKVTNGFVKYIVNNKGEDMMISKIIKMVEEAQASKAPIEKITDKVANVFTKVVLSIAIISFIIWFIVTKDFNHSITTAVSILVIACPCSLGLATPTAIIVGSGVAARNGIFYKDAESLEEFGKIKIFAFDKTGTLTTGDFDFIDYYTTLDKDEFLKILGSIEQYSSHKIAKSITEFVKDNGIQLSEIKDYKEISGIGVEGYYNSKKVEIGKFNNEIDDEKVREYLSHGLTIISAKMDGKFIGYWALIDKLKDNAIEVIKYLKNEGCKTILISGDNEKCTYNIGRILNIDKTYSNVMPLDKANIIKEEMKENKVCMIGDGINDSVALTTASVGVSFTNGTNIAVESSDIILMNDKLEDLVTARKLSKKIMRHIKQNLFFAFFYNSIGISLAVAGILNPMIGALAMSFSSVSVVSNSLRINLFKKEK